MKPADRHRLFVRWGRTDRAYVGYCPDFFPWGGVCHGATKEAAFRKLRTLVREEVARLEMRWDKTFATSRRKLVPAARVRGIHTDKDVFRTVS